MDLFSTELFEQTHISYSFFFNNELGVDKGLERIDTYHDRFEYLGDVESNAIRLVDTCELLLNIHNQILNDAPDTYLRTLGFERIDFFHYTIQNYYIRISTIYDLLLVVSSNLLRLGIRESDLNEKHLLNNKIYKNYDFISSIKDFKSLINDIKPKRNTIIHRGYLQDDRLHELRVSPKFSGHRIDGTTSKTEDFRELWSKYEEEMKILNLRAQEIVSRFLNLTGKYYKEYFNKIPKNGG
ncbi:Cthe_2314 family HEPN domain-containing protein [Marinoscillum pacificum]|uniref:Cthe_2314 family HEPN domain-containing protein n=1 Tax=Marinoscillum pacificum TaxID=392723 RepID=UPI00215706DE|nr:Cthe_2314 family HEPN domain-containing protein [Marinoscillum pacificum]